MSYKITWQPPTPPDVYYRLRIESDTVSIANLALTVPEVKGALTAIRDEEEYHPRGDRPWWVEAEHGPITFNIQGIEEFASVWASIPGEQVQGVLEEIIEHAQAGS